LRLAIAAFGSRTHGAAQMFDPHPGRLDRQFAADGSPRSGVVGQRLRHKHLRDLQV
jgi:hypothetical protein